MCIWDLTAQAFDKARREGHMLSGSYVEMCPAEAKHTSWKCGLKPLAIRRRRGALTDSGAGRAFHWTRGVGR